MLNLLDFGELINYTEYVYDKAYNTLKYIKYEDLEDEIRIVTHIHSGSKYMSRVYLSEKSEPVLINTSSYDYNRIKTLALSRQSLPPKVHTSFPLSTEPFELKLNNHVTLEIPGHCKAIEERNIVTISSVIDLDTRTDRYVIEGNNVYYKLEQTDSCIGAIISCGTESIEARLTGNASALVKDIPYLYNNYNAIYKTKTLDNEYFTKCLYLETDEYGIIKNYIEDPNHVGAYKQRHLRRNTETKSILYERDDREIKCIHPLFVDPVDITKINDFPKYYVVETLAPKDVYRRSTVMISDNYMLKHLLEEMNRKYTHIEYEHIESIIL